MALAAVRAGQARGRGAWCAWVDPEGTLHAPGVVAAGVELARMLVDRIDFLSEKIDRLTARVDELVGVLECRLEEQSGTSEIDGAVDGAE